MKKLPGSRAEAEIAPGSAWRKKDLWLKFGVQTLINPFHPFLGKKRSRRKQIQGDDTESAQPCQASSITISE
jgi:hypothetical protein